MVVRLGAVRRDLVQHSTEIGDNSLRMAVCMSLLYIMLRYEIRSRETPIEDVEYDSLSYKSDDVGIARINESWYAKNSVGPVVIGAHL